MKYFVYNEDGFGWFIFPKENDIIPHNSIEVKGVCGLKKPKYNFKTKGLEEGLSIEEIKLENQLKIGELNKLQYEELSLTDWYFTRFIETGIEVPEDVIQQRKDIRLKYDDLKRF